MGMFDGVDSGPVHLDSYETMCAVLKELVGEDGLIWRGGVAGWGEENPPRPVQWSLELNDNKGNKVAARIGDYLVMAYGRLLVLDAVEAGA